MACASYMHSHLDHELRLAGMARAWHVQEDTHHTYTAISIMSSDSQAMEH